MKSSNLFKSFKVLNIFFFFSLCTLCLCGLLFVFPLSAQDRPSDEDIFGSDSTTQGTDNSVQPSDKNTEQNKDGKRTDGMTNPLQVGGTFYYRYIASPQKNTDIGKAPMSMPLQLDVFLDGRPTDRIRVFLSGRLAYDPTRDEFSRTTSGTNLGSSQLSSTPVASTMTSNNIPNNPTVILDQAWLKFDISRSVFLTAGNQHVKWGTGRFWNPTDFINTQRRDPLIGYDLRTGLPMLRVDVPFESISSNISAIAFFDQPLPSSTLRQMGAALRAEFVIGDAEVGIDGAYKDGQRFSAGADISSPLGPFDVYAEAAYLNKSPSPHYTLTRDITLLGNLSDFYTAEEFNGPIFQATAGISYTFAWLLNRTATVGAEYNYNQIGYDTAKVYPILILNNNYDPFYLGVHYAGIYLTAEGPDKGNHTSYTLSVLSNLSDMSFIGRLDFNWEFLTYMSFQAFVSGHFGTEGGEFNFALDTPAVTYQGSPIPPIQVPATILDIGFAFRTSF